MQILRVVHTKFDIFVLISYPLKDVRVYAYCFRTRNAFVSLLYTTDMDIIYKTILDHMVSILVFFGSCFCDVKLSYFILISDYSGDALYLRM
jgi:hypothetical protein